ncbi:MAG: 3-hydroxyacyl-ACP dehydratase FabZ [Candidatus Gastranaerophilales bacterium]|nr:3-hydroxyacyl-ACP dehydratase FabZ [Candidatus Gastranaerophilales bacterium]
MMSENVTKSMDINEILKMLPHRYPFLLVDRITECESEKYVKGYKNVTYNEPFFQGHFPDYPIMPGVLQIEALAQISAAIIHELPQYQNKLAVFAGIDNARFKKAVKPGDRLDMYSELTKTRGPIVKCHVKGSVDGQLAVEADLTVSVIDKPSN